MNSINNTIDNLGRRIPLMICLFLGISTMSMAQNIDNERLTKEEAFQLISEVKHELNLMDYELDFVVDDQGNVKPELIKMIMIYDGSNNLLLEAPIHTLEQMANKQLRTIVNACDFLAELNNVFIYRLDL
ncbi:hypothetical protein [Roseivirga echinicomitans]|nr:hypothetical protein [Roseivirga echinicomitans]